MRTACRTLLMVLVTSVYLAGEETKEPDLSTPRSAILSFKDAISKRDWQTAERCLASDLREMLRNAMVDRTFFDQYVVKGFGTKTQQLIPAAMVTDKAIADLSRLENPGQLPDRFTTVVGTGGSVMPWIAECTFVREKDAWKLTVGTTRHVTTKEDFLRWYEEAIVQRDRGTARKLEGHPVEQTDGDATSKSAPSAPSKASHP